ncbi:hypothetical protein ATCC90586_004411 [Pythium insidiosum]|nr:hypothetical protein ATCC90586_004411 [Pythium insidiosum]
MCGIALLLERVALDGGHDSARRCLRAAAVQEELQRRLSQRGPDHFAVVTPGTAPPWADLQLASAVLHLRGDALVAQPTVDARGNVLCWNGEVFGGLETAHSLYDDGSQSDTAALSAALAKAAAAAAAADNDDDELVARVLELVRAIEGPFAFAWLHAASQRVFFGHDRFGRRSLLSLIAPEQHGHGQEQEQEQDAEDLLTRLASSPSRSACVSIAGVSTFCLSSVALRSVSASSGASFHEVPCTGVFSLDLGAQTLSFHAYAPLAPCAAVPVDRYACGLPAVAPETPLDVAAQHLLTVLSNAVGVRVRTIPPPRAAGAARVAVLFSGGLDSVVLAALTHLHVAAADEPIDLLNVCFDAASQFRSPDRQAAERSLRELRARFPTRRWRLVRIDVPFAAVLQSQRALLDALAPCDTHMDFNIGAAFWWLARGRGVVTTAAAAANETENENENGDDLNAFLREDGVPPAQRELEAALQALALFPASEDPACPVPSCRFKRKPGCALGVCRLCCLRLQRLVRRAERAADSDTEMKMDATGATAKDAAAAVRQLDALLAPETAAALLGTCRAIGPLELCRVHRDKRPTAKTRPASACTAEQTATQQQQQQQQSAEVAGSTYTTAARVLLVGVGADEQLGGYGRHRTAFLTRGAAGLEAELARDLQRIWKRNLGRDDRVLAAHARETRLPFLDERVVAWLAALPVPLRCDLSRERARGDGDKLVLRRVARALGLSHCATLAKRAIQFGTRIAKHSNRHAFGSNRQASGDAKLRLEARDAEHEDEEDEESET